MPRRFLTFLVVVCASLVAAAQSPELRRAPIIEADGARLRDLNKNGTLDPYEDRRVPVPARVADLLGRMTLEEKAGLMIHASLMGFTGPGGVVLDAPAATGGPPFRIRQQPGVQPMDRPSPRQLLLDRNIRWILVRPTAGEPPDVTARFSNAMQEIAESSRLGIPIVFSSDPRHSPRRGDTTAPVISTWPEQAGFGAIRKAETVREFGKIGARELRALGIAVTLSPMADIATEPRWNRIAGTFGEDPATVSELTAAYIKGFQGDRLGPESVLTVTKHFPGDGPVKDGFDPHNSYGKWQVYPGGKFDLHVEPFRSSIAVGTGGMMGAYAIPVGFDTVGASFSRAMITDLLRTSLRYDRLVVTDWLRNMPWGVEDLSEKQRQQRIVDAGVDQIGGDNDPKFILEAVKDGAVSTARIDASARRVLTPMFELGLFENPYVDPDKARSTVGSSAFLDAGRAAQRASIVVLKNAKGLLPLQASRKLYVENFDRTAAARYGTVVENLGGADAAIVGVDAPYAVRKDGMSFFAGAHEGTLAFDGAENASQLEMIRRVAASKVPTTVCMYMERPAVLTEFIDDVASVLVHFNSSDEALLDIVFGRAEPTGKLPFDLPRDMPSVLRQKPDVPFDLENPLFRFGFGLTYERERSRH